MWCKYRQPFSCWKTSWRRESQTAGSLFVRLNRKTVAVMSCYRSGFVFIHVFYSKLWNFPTSKLNQSETLTHLIPRWLHNAQKTKHFIMDSGNGLDHQGASSSLMCSRGVRWNQSRPGRATRKVLVESATPHCSFPPCAQPVSRSTPDDGALSFRVERALKVRVGQRPSSLILAGFCHLVQQDKWTFDTQSDHTLAQLW